MSPQINKQLVRKSFGKRLFSYANHAVVQASMADDLVWQLREAHPDAFGRVLEIGCGSGMLTAAFLKRFQVESYYANDLVEDCRHEVASILKQHPGSRFTFVGGDIEQVSALPEYVDVIISNATFQWLNNLPEFFPRLRQHLRPGGLLAFSTFGPENLREIRQLTGISLNYLSYQQLRALLDQHFDVVWSDESVVSLQFSSPLSVLRHMRLTGVNGVKKHQWTKSRLQQFEQQYWQVFGAQEQVPLTYHPILCIAQV